MARPAMRPTRHSISSRNQTDAPSRVPAAADARGERSRPAGMASTIATPWKARATANVCSQKVALYHVRGEAKMIAPRPAAVTTAPRRRPRQAIQKLAQTSHSETRGRT